MSVSDMVDEARSGIRTALAIGGAISLVAGVLILIKPEEFALFVTALLGVYALIAGLYYVGFGLASRRSSFWGHLGFILLGALYIIAGVIFFSNLNMALATLTIVVPIMIGAVWLVEGVVTLTSAGSTSSVAWAIFYGIISILAGLALLFAPVLYASFLWTLTGIALVILGVVQLVRSIQS